MWSFSFVVLVPYELLQIPSLPHPHPQTLHLAVPDAVPVFSVLSAMVQGTTEEKEGIFERKSE